MRIYFVIKIISQVKNTNKIFVVIALILQVRPTLFTEVNIIKSEELLLLLLLLITNVWKT